MKENKRPQIVGIVFLTILLALIYWLSYSNAINDCTYSYYDQSTSCIVKQVFGIDDLFNISSILYCIGKNFWLLVYLFLVYKMMKPKKINHKLDILKNESLANEEQSNGEIDETNVDNNNQMPQYNLTKKEYGIILCVLLILIALVVLFAYLTK